MIVFPFAKINLGLNVIRMREDGYREIGSVLVPIPLYDILEVILKPPGERTLKRTGIPVPGPVAGDLVWRAADLLDPDRQWGLEVHLHKLVPIGAGLGGGSSDGSHMLLALDRLFERRTSASRLHQAASALGSDCPFFLRREPCLASGRGEDLEPIDLDLSPYSLLLIAPDIHISTASAYAGTPLSGRSSDLRAILSEPVENWRHHLRNDMEDYAFRAHPELAKIKDQLYAAGAIYASMSGSGSAMYGLFRSAPPDGGPWSDMRHWVLPLGHIWSRS
ncbi:MAG: 4-(cytidine 5'-diphospho)-2-C-methyl-D-erythritol kinase [Flavobacteriales bacterium]|nr:4-(cytidine 5'-diphospho)-2-C-methyl-D-erythritol kinase [Flavobacteriales bacterium]